MFTRRWGIAPSIVLILLSWKVTVSFFSDLIGLVFLIISAGMSIGFFIALASTREDLDNHRNRLIWFPWTRNDLFHNKRARLRRRILELEIKRDRCKLLIEKCNEPQEELRVPILRAEMKAASREIDLLVGDVNILETGKYEEDKAIEYKELTS